MWHESTGRIVYDPRRGGMKKRTKWWCVLNVDKEITRYYRWWVKRRYHIQLHKPSWDAHVSIFRGEQPEDHLMHLWKKYDGMKIPFKYKHDVRQSGDTTGWDRPDHYWFVEVDCPFIMDMREEMNRPTKWKLHLTIGRTY